MVGNFWYYVIEIADKLKGLIISGTYLKTLD